MNTGMRLLVSVLFIFVSLWWMILGSYQLLGRPWFRDAMVAMNGVIPLVLVVVGSLSLWVAVDDAMFRREESRGRIVIQPTLRKEDPRHAAEGA